MNTENLSDFDIAFLLKSKVDNLKKELENAELAFSVYAHHLKEVSVGLVRTRKPQGNIKETIIGVVRKATLSDRAENAFKLVNVPLTSRELLNQINDASKDRQWSFGEFSGQWSNISKNPNKPFMQIEFPDNPNNIRYFYGFKDWFDGETLKNAYLAKLKAKHNINDISPLFGK